MSKRTPPKSNIMALIGSRSLKCLIIHYKYVKLQTISENFSEGPLAQLVRAPDS